MRIETATLTGNNKRGREVFKATLAADLKAFVASITGSTLDAHEIGAIFENANLPLLPGQVSMLTTRSNAGHVDSEAEAIERGERARAHHGKPNEEYFTKRQMIPAPTDTVYPSQVKRHGW